MLLNRLTYVQYVCYILGNSVCC